LLNLKSERNPLTFSLRITLHVVPGAKKTEAAGLHGDALKVRVSAPPVDGKANAALQRFLADTFGLPLNAVEQTSGLTQRRKGFVLHFPVAEAHARGQAVLAQLMTNKETQ
jgi:uncharacterized protein